jgi:hypothetical protein
MLRAQVRTATKVNGHWTAITPEQRGEPIDEGADVHHEQNRQAG